MFLLESRFDSAGCGVTGQRERRMVTRRQRVNSRYFVQHARRRRKYDNAQTNPRSPVQRGAACSPKLRFPRPCSTVRPS